MAETSGKARESAATINCKHIQNSGKNGKPRLCAKYAKYVRFKMITVEVRSLTVMATFS